MTSKAAILALLITACYSPLTLSAPEDPPNADEIRAMLQANGTGDIAKSVAPVTAQQVSIELHRRNPNLPARADTVITDVVTTYLRQMAESDHVIEKLIPIYAKYMSKADVRSITEFYKSPAGRHWVSATPAISLESAKIGREWMESIVPGLQAELQHRLESENLIERPPAR